MSDTGPVSVEESTARDPSGSGAPQSAHGSDSRESHVAAPESAPPGAGTGPVSDAGASSVPQDHPQFPTRFGLSRGDTWFALVIGGVILALMIFHWGRLTWRGEPRVEIDRLQAEAYEFQLDINRATWVEWMQLEDIGETLARRIVADREERGPFQSIDDLNRVSGIGPKTLAAIRPHLRCPDCPTSDETSP